jgi:hypothetical protein
MTLDEGREILAAIALQNSTLRFSADQPPKLLKLKNQITMCVHQVGNDVIVKRVFRESAHAIGHAVTAADLAMRAAAERSYALHQSELRLNLRFVPVLIAAPWHLRIAEPLLMQEDNDRGELLLAFRRMQGDRVGWGRDCLPPAMRLIGRFHAANWALNKSALGGVIATGGVSRTTATLPIWRPGPRAANQVINDLMGGSFNTSGTLDTLRLERAAAAAMQLMDSWEPQTLIHGDLGPHNLFTTSGPPTRLGLIDFEHGGRAPPMRELVVALGWIDLGTTNVTTLLCEYRAALSIGIMHHARVAAVPPAPSVQELQMQLDVAFLEYVLWGIANGLILNEYMLSRIRLLLRVLDGDVVLLADSSAYLAALTRVVEKHS